jgi:rhodanese-related sulfurtransferase
MGQLEEVLKTLDEKFFMEGNHRLTAEEFFNLWNEDKAMLLDVRTPKEVEALPLTKFGIHIPLNELPDRLDDIPKDKIVGIFCHGRHRSGMAYLYLKGKGFNNVKVITAMLEEFVEYIKPVHMKNWKKL